MVSTLTDDVSHQQVRQDNVFSSYRIQNNLFRVGLDMVVECLRGVVIRHLKNIHLV